MQREIDKESDSENGAVDYTIMSRKALDSSVVPLLEIPFTAQDVISRIEQAQLRRAREDVNMRLGDIMLNVQRIINRYTVDEHVHSGRKISLLEHKKRRTNLLEKMVTYTKAAEMREKILVYILAWLEEWNAILSEMTEIDIEEHHHWIAQMQILPETFKAIEGNVKRLSRISTSLLEEKRKQKKKITSRSTLWKSWKERVIKRPATAHALRPDQMISDEFATNTKVSEIQDMLQELIGTAMFNKLENNAIKYISSTIVNLSKALRTLNDEVKVFNLQSANMYINETSEREKELSLKIIQDLREKNEMLQQKLQDAEEKREQLIRSKAIVERQVHTALPTSTLKVLPKLSPQSSMVISKADVEDSMDSVLAKELENIVDEAQRKGTKASGIKWDSTISYTAQVEMTPDLTEQQYPLPEKKQEKSSSNITEDIAEDKISLKEGGVYQKDGTDPYQLQKTKHTKGPDVHETSGPNLSDDKGEHKVSETKLDHHSELQALEKKKKERKPSSEAKSKSSTESKSQHVPADFLSMNINSQSGKSGTSSVWDQLRKVRPEHSLDKSQISSEKKEEPTTESMAKESKSEMSSQAEPFRLIQLDYSSEKVKTTGKKHPISLGTTTSKEGKTEEKDVLAFDKKIKSHELVKSQSRITKETSESTRALGSLDGKSEQSNLEEFQKAIMAFLKEKIDNIGKPLDKKTVPREELLLKTAEVEKLGIIKAKIEEYFQNVAETVTKILRKYKDIKHAGQVAEKPLKPEKVASFMPGLHFQKPFSVKSEISPLLSRKSMDPVIDNLIQMILTEIESERDVPVDSTGGRDHKEKEKQRQEEYLQEDQKKMLGMSLKTQLEEERNLWKKSYEMINKNLEKEEARLQRREGKQAQQRQKQRQEEEGWQEQQKQRRQKRIERDETRKQRGEEGEEQQKPQQQQLEARKQTVQEQGVPLGKEKGQQTRQVPKEVRHGELESSWEKEEETQRPRRKPEAEAERQRRREAQGQMKTKPKNSEELEEMFSQTSVTLSPRWTSIPKDTSQSHHREEFQRNLKTLDVLADGKHLVPITPPTSTQSSSPGAFPISGQSPTKSMTLTPQQAQALGVSLTPQQAQALGITLTPQQAQALGITLTPQQAQTLGITLTPQQAQARGITLTPQQAQTLGITLTPQQAQARGMTLTPQQAQALGITLTPQQAQALGVTLTPQQAQAQGITLTPHQAQALGITLTPQQAQAQGITLTPQQAQALGITLTPQQAQALGITLTPQQAQAQGITLTPQQAQALGITLTPQQAQALGITLTPQQAQALGITLTPQQAQAQGITLTPQQAQALGITLTPQQAQALGITLTPQQAQAQGITLTPQQAQALGMTLTPQQAQALGITLTPQQAQALGITLTPQQAQAQGITLTPQQAQALGITLTPQQAQALGITLTPQQAQAQGISLTPQQAQAQGISLTPQQAQAQGITLTPEQAQALGITVTPQQAQEMGITLTPQQAQALGMTLTPQQAQAQGITLTSEQFQTLVGTLTSEKPQGLGVTLTSEQIQALGPLTSQQAQSLEGSLTPEQAQLLQGLLVPEQAQALLFTLAPEKAWTLGITRTHEQAQGVDITLTPEQARALGVPPTLDGAQALKTPLTAEQAQKLGVSITPKVVQEVSNTLILKQIQALGITSSHEQAQTFGIPFTLDQAHELGVPITSDKAHALESPHTPEQVQPLGAPFTPGQAQPMGTTFVSEQDLKSRAPLVKEQPSRLWTGLPSGHTLDVGIFSFTDKSVTPSAPRIPKQSPTLAPSTPFLPAGQSVTSSPRQFPASSAPIAEKSSIFEVSSTPLQISRSPLTQAPFVSRKSLGMRILSDSGKLLAPQTFPSSRQIPVSKGQSTSVRFLTPEVPPIPGKLPIPGVPPTPGQPLALEDLLSSRQFFISRDSLTPQSPLISKDPFAPRQPLISGVPPTSAQIPSLWALSPGKPLVPGASSIPGELLESGPLTLSEQSQALQPPATHEQSPYLQAPSTLGQHLAPWTLPRQASPLWIPPTPGYPPTLWIPSTPGKPQKDLSSFVSKKSKDRLAIISSLKSKSVLAHPSAPNVKITQAPFTTEKFQISEVSDTSEEIQMLHDPFATEQFRTFQSYLTNYRTPVSQTPYIDEGALLTFMKPVTSLPSLTTQLSKTPQISPSEWDQKSRFPPIDKPWMLTSVLVTKKPKMRVPPSSPQELKEQRYFVDVEAQRKNLVLLSQATKASGLRSELHTTARNLIIETLHTDTVRLGYLFRKYIAYRLIQCARNNIIKQLEAIQNTGKGYESQNLYIMLSRIDDYQKKVMWLWTKKQKSLEQKRNQCLRNMIFLFSQLQETCKLNLSQPIPLIIHKKQIPASTKFVQRPFLGLLIQEDRKSDIFKKFRQEDQMEAIWNADLSTSSYPITEKTSIHSLWAQLGGYPDIPMLLPLDVQSTFRKSLAFIQSQ
ncbi:protein FAM186A [Diceros bicornis minor]|uniref:protein FAM186A n=1 Tax=Diceros bicornis minor TaxID=77932 RepID=UPI0026EEE52B|nr:protein FAM186A [Diceros bicornis minor]